MTGPLKMIFIANVIDFHLKSYCVVKHALKSRINLQLIVCWVKSSYTNHAYCMV